MSPGPGGVSAPALAAADLALAPLLLPPLLLRRHGQTSQSEPSIRLTDQSQVACEEAQGLCATVLVCCSLLLVFATLPLSLCFVIKVVQASNIILLHISVPLCRSMSVQSSSG